VARIDPNKLTLLTPGIDRKTGEALPYERIGRVIRYRRSALDRWRAARTATSTLQAA